MEIEIDADLSKVPDGPIEAAKYALDQVHRLADPLVVVHRFNADGTLDNWMVDTSDGAVAVIGNTTWGPSAEQRILAQQEQSEQEEDIPILPGCLVERIDTGLDAREVVSIGRDWLTLDIMGTETQRLPIDNYRAVEPADGRL